MRDFLVFVGYSQEQLLIVFLIMCEHLMIFFLMKILIAFLVNFK